MYCLFLDIAFGEGFFALFRDGTVVEKMICPLVAARQPVSIFDSFLHSQNITLSDVTFLACGIGPGSYTGIRSACSVARGISFCTHKKIVAVPSLLLFVPEEKGEYSIATHIGPAGVLRQNVSFDGKRYTYEEPVVVAPETQHFEGELISPSPEWFNARGIPVRAIKGHMNIVACVAYDLYREGKVYDAHTLPILYVK